MATYPYGLYLRATLQPPAPDSLPTHNPKLRMHTNTEPPLGQVVVAACCNSQMTTQSRKTVHLQRKVSIKEGEWVTTMLVRGVWYNMPPNSHLWPEEGRWWLKDKKQLCCSLPVPILLRFILIYLNLSWIYFEWKERVRECLGTWFIFPHSVSHTYAGIERNKQNKESTTIAQLTTHVQDSMHISKWLLPQYRYKMFLLVLHSLLVAYMNGVLALLITKTPRQTRQTWLNLLAYTRVLHVKRPSRSCQYSCQYLHYILNWISNQK